MPMVGGHSEKKEVDAEHREKFLAWRGVIEAHSGKTYEMFEPVAYTQQVVAGMIYHICITISEGVQLHAKVFQPLPHTGAPAECQSVVEGPCENEAHAGGHQQ